EHERVAGGLLPGEMLRPLQELAVLNARELGERAVRGFVAPDALRRREHRIAAVTFLVVAVVLIAMDHNLVANFPTLHLRRHRPDDARRIRAGDMIGVLEDVECRERLP